eukprot:TRINITY_DN9521_c0_g2_i1.p1 TRINITY_DN9521_c0_g2~~TRINITY_DN9521_c0_g2_i1.p1  ORF type:complete len:233 (-),score=88.89 TRINITY_DN9521_c0_g2_i1:35-733(-)
MAASLDNRTEMLNSGAVVLSDSDSDQEETELEMELAQMRADIQANEETIQSLALRIAEGNGQEAELAQQRELLQAAHQGGDLCGKGGGLSGLLQEIEEDEALLTELSITGGETRQLKEDVAALQEEKWRMGECFELERLKERLLQEEDASSLESMRQDELELEAAMAEMQAQLDQVRESEEFFRQKKEALQREIEEFTALGENSNNNNTCLLYTSDAADEEDSGDSGGRRIL